jgi:hypothetical protein
MADYLPRQLLEPFTRAASDALELMAEEHRGESSEMELEPQALFSTAELWKAIDQMRQEMAAHADYQQRDSDSEIATAESVALALSTAILMALLRSGSLYAVALSSLPLWSRVDPLAVLSLSDEERRKREKELRAAEAEEDESEKGIGRVLDERPSTPSEPIE